jgi:exodeoxyribonuclease VIII
MDNFMRSPLHYITMKKNPPPPTPQMFVGSAFHALVLEPERFKVEYVPDQYRGSTAKEAKAWREAMREEGKTVINTMGGDDIWNASDWDMIHLMRDAVLNHPIASILLQGDGGTEQSYFWIDKKQGDYAGTGKLCKARIDKYNSDHEVIIDLKSTVDASYSEFQGSVHRYGYSIQDSFYSDGWIACAMPFKAFIFIACEKQPPYGVACYTLDREWRRVGKEIYQRTLQKFAVCMKSGEWPCYPAEVRDLVMPGYGKYHKIS